jgi:hypothetical protein
MGEIVETLVEEIVIDPECKVMQLKGAFDRVVQFNIEKGGQGNSPASLVAV